MSKKSYLNTSLVHMNPLVAKMEEFLRNSESSLIRPNEPVKYSDLMEDGGRFQWQ